MTESSYLILIFKWKKLLNRFLIENLKINLTKEIILFYSISYALNLENFFKILKIMINKY